MRLILATRESPQMHAIRATTSAQSHGRPKKARGGSSNENKRASPLITPQKAKRLEIRRGKKGLSSHCYIQHVEFC